jgi:hypothetical protein
MSLAAVLVVLIGFLLVVVEGIDALDRKFFWTIDVIRKFGKPGIGFANHLGLWSDLAVLPLLCGYIVNRFGDTWSWKRMGFFLGVGFVITLGNHINLIMNQVRPDILGCVGEKWSLTIAVHFIYMTCTIAIVGLFYFSPGVTFKEAVAVSVIMGLHCMLGTHIPLGLANLWWHLPSQPTDLLHARVFYMSGGLWVVFAILAGIAAGFPGGYLTALIGAFALILAKFIQTVH